MRCTHGCIPLPNATSSPAACRTRPHASSVLVVPTASDVSARQQMHFRQNMFSARATKLNFPGILILLLSQPKLYFFGHTSATSPPAFFLSFRLFSFQRLHFSVEFVQVAVFRGPQSGKAAAVCKCWALFRTIGSSESGVVESW